MKKTITVTKLERVALDRVDVDFPTYAYFGPDPRDGRNWSFRRIGAGGDATVVKWQEYGTGFDRRVTCEVVTFRYDLDNVGSYEVEALRGAGEHRSSEGEFRGALELAMWHLEGLTRRPA